MPVQLLPYRSLKQTLSDDVNERSKTQWREHRLPLNWSTLQPDF